MLIFQRQEKELDPSVKYVYSAVASAKTNYSKSLFQRGTRDLNNLLMDDQESVTYKSSNSSPFLSTHLPPKHLSCPRNCYPLRTSLKLKPSYLHTYFLCGFIHSDLFSLLLATSGHGFCCFSCASYYFRTTVN